MKINKVDPEEDKTHETKLSLLRSIFLIIQLFVILSNRFFDTAQILTFMPELNNTQTGEFKEIAHSFQAVNTLSLVFIIMQLIIFYVGTNRWKVGPTFYTVFLHLIGTIAYSHHSRWQFQNIWMIFHLFSFLPLVSEIAVALYTAKV